MRHCTTNAAPVRYIVISALVLCAGGAVYTATTKGPDAGGYTGTDATTYSFVDVSGASGGIGILSGVDDGTAALALPFAFQFYGQPHSMVCVSSNGALYFVAGEAACAGLNDFANTDLTAVSPPNDPPALLPLWSDLTFQVAGAGAVFYQTLGTAGARRFIVQWNDAFPQGSPQPVTFQIVLGEAGNTILFQYETVNLGPGNPASNGAQATIGVRNAGALTNQQQVAWSFGAPVVGDNTAILFSPAPLSTPDGLLSGGGFVAVGNQQHHFVLRVSQQQQQDAGRLEYWVTGGDPVNRFEALAVSDVLFSSDAASVKGTGRWNGRAGYTFEAQAADHGEPGSGHDTFSIVVRDTNGAVVGSVSGVLGGGNIQSSRRGR